MYTFQLPGTKDSFFCSTSEKNDSGILTFFSNFYNIPKSILEKLDTIAIVVDHKYGEIHCTWNQKHEPNDHLTIFQFKEEFTDDEFNFVKKQKYFVETWRDAVKGYES